MFSHGVPQVNQSFQQPSSSTDGALSVLEIEKARTRLMEIVEDAKSKRTDMLMKEISEICDDSPLIEKVGQLFAAIHLQKFSKNEKKCNPRSLTNLNAHVQVQLVHILTTNSSEEGFQEKLQHFFSEIGSTLTPEVHRQLFRKMVEEQFLIKDSQFAREIVAIDPCYVGVLDKEILLSDDFFQFLDTQDLKRLSAIYNNVTLGILLRDYLPTLEDKALAKKWFDLDLVFVRECSEDVLRANVDFLFEQDLNMNSGIVPGTTLGQLLVERAEKGTYWLTESESAKEWFERDPIFIKAWSRDVLRANEDFLLEQDWSQTSYIGGGTALGELLGKLLAERAEKGTYWLTEPESAKEWFERDVIFIKAWSRDVVRANANFLLEQNWNKQSDIKPGTTLGQMLREIPRFKGVVGERFGFYKKMVG